MKCVLCGVEFSDAAEDMFCHGCQSHICNDCDANPNLPFGQHRPSDHRDDESPED